MVEAGNTAERHRYSAMPFAPRKLKKTKGWIQNAAHPGFLGCWKDSFHTHPPMRILSASHM